MTETVEAPATHQDIAQATDERGRLITVKRLNALQFYRLSKALGAGSSANSTTMDIATLVCTVTRIDAEDVAFPSNERDVEFLIQKLDFDGMKAASEALGRLSGGVGDEVEAAKN